VADHAIELSTAVGVCLPLCHPIDTVEACSIIRGEFGIRWASGRRLCPRRTRSGRAGTIGEMLLQHVLDLLWQIEVVCHDLPCTDGILKIVGLESSQATQGVRVITKLPELTVATEL
jgi:hypothetical protein